MSSLTEKVVASLSDEIRRGALRPGDRIPTEVAMMKQLSVSRSVVREAISRLQAAKVVETRHGIGTFVLEPATEQSMQLPAADLSSMLDVMFILIIFFLVTTTFKEEEIDHMVNLPVDAKNQSLTQSTGNLIKINIRKSGAYVLMGKQVT